MAEAQRLNEAREAKWLSQRHETGIGEQIKDLSPGAVGPQANYPTPPALGSASALSKWVHDVSLGDLEEL